MIPLSLTNERPVRHFVALGLVGQQAMRLTHSPAHAPKSSAGFRLTCATVSQPSGWLRVRFPQTPNRIRPKARERDADLPMKDAPVPPGRSRDVGYFLTKFSVAS